MRTDWESRPSGGERLARKCLLVFASSLALWPITARADEAATKAEARVHFERGLSLLDTGDLNGAAAEFQSAHTLYASALAAYDAALAHAQLSHPLLAVRLLREAAELSATPALHDKILALLHEQEALLGTLLVRVTDRKGSPVTPAELQATGYARNELHVGQVAELSPGTLTLRIVAEGHPAIERIVDVAPGSRQELTVVLELSEPPPPPAATSSDPIPAVAPPPPAAPVVKVDVPRSKVGGVVTTVVGAAIMVGSAAVLWDADRGFVQLSPQVDSFNASTAPGAWCSRGNHVADCKSRSEELNQQRADLNRERALGFVGLGVGTVTAAVGVVWWLSAANPGTTAAQLPVRVMLGPSAASLIATGAF